MKRLMLAAMLAAMIVMPLGGTGLAVDESGNYVIIGAGTLKCLSWVEERLKISGKALAYTSWVQGYVSSHNEYAAGVKNAMEGVDAAGLNSWIDDYCKDHPENDLHSAAETMIKYFKAKRQ